MYRIGKMYRIETKEEGKPFYYTATIREYDPIEHKLLLETTGGEELVLDTSKLMTCRVVGDKDERRL